MFSTANVAGLGTVVVDGRGHTVYVLSADGTTNAPCDDASGCTKVWPDLPFPDGTSAATAGAGLQASLLGSMKLADGETYPTYNKWLVYEYVGDSAAGQGHGEGLTSFGGTWYALGASGNLVMPSGGSTATTAASGGGSGY
jgi:predicted lipoprotein with Yx(FWY)xxD motif